MRQYVKIICIISIQNLARYLCRVFLTLRVITMRLFIWLQMVYHLWTSTKNDPSLYIKFWIFNVPYWMMFLIHWQIMRYIYLVWPIFTLNNNIPSSMLINKELTMSLLIARRMNIVIDIPSTLQKEECHHFSSFLDV